MTTFIDYWQKMGYYYALFSNESPLKIAVQQVEGIGQVSQTRRKIMELVRPYGGGCFTNEQYTMARFAEMDTEKLLLELSACVHEAADTLSKGFALNSRCYQGCKIKVEIAFAAILARIDGGTPLQPTDDEKRERESYIHGRL